MNWTSVEGATGYRIFVKNKQTGRWDTVLRAVDADTTETITQLHLGTKYTFAVRAYINENDFVWSPSYKSVVALTNPGVTEAIFSSSTKDSVTLNWEKVEGATGYRVYIVKDGKWQALKTTGATSYTATSLDSGKEYTFAVKAYTKYNGNYYWAEKYAKYSSITLPGTTSKIIVTNITSESISLGWEKVEGATGYRVYRRNEQTGKWETEIQATAKLYATVKDLSASESYTFAVRAYKKYDGAYYWAGAYKKITATTSPSVPRKNNLQIYNVWSDKIYGKMTFGDSGCGIMSVSNAVYNLNGTFIDPLELADWAYANKLYNRNGYGGSATNIVSKLSGQFGEKYGFKLEKTYTDYGTLKSNSTVRNDMINHLLGGGTVVAHVYQHYFIIVDYDEATQKFLVFDSYPGTYYGEDTGSRRYGYTTEAGDWKTAAELSVYPLDLDRFYLISAY